MKTAKTGAFLATAVGLMFMANVALAQSNGAGGGSAPSAQTAKVKCMGANSCKGNSSCKTAQNDCKGQNVLSRLQVLRNARKTVARRQVVN